MHKAHLRLMIYLLIYTKCTGQSYKTVGQMTGIYERTIYAKICSPHILGV